jgi:adenosylmethionine-8-amino-7-oxononanoate aminotransferase
VTDDGDRPAWVARDAAVVWHGFTQMSAYAESDPVMVARAEGRELIDVDGRRYLDAISSLWVNTLGHHVRELDDAIRDQLELVAHSTMLGNGNTVVVELAEALAKVVPVEDAHFLFAADGASAVEQALKVAIQSNANLGRPERTGFVALTGAYHGDTVGAMSLGDDEAFGADAFGSLRFPVARAASCDAAADVVRDRGDELCAVIDEPEPLARLAAACRDAEVLLIADEIATGFGRTGTLFAVEQAGVRPDILVLGKGLTAGYLPMSATAVSRRVYDAFLGPDLSSRTLYHGHSFGGNALAAAVALRHLDLLDAWEVLANVRARSAQLGALLDEQVRPQVGVKEVRLLGLMGGVELAPPVDGLRWGRRVSAACVKRGVLLRSIGDVITLMPILTSTADEVERLVDALAESIAEVCRP